MGSGSDSAERLRTLPSVERLAATLDAPHALAVVAARTAIECRREELRAGAEDDVDLAERARAELSRPRRRRCVGSSTPRA